MKENKIKELLSQFGRLFGRRKKESSKNLQFLLELSSREPTNGHPHLKIGEIYQKLGEKQNALQEYLKAAEIFCNFEQYHKGASIFIKILKQNPEMDSVKIKLADTYRKMGFLEQAFIQYYKLFCSYRNIGMKDKALEIVGMMAELDPQRFTLDASNSLDPEDSDGILKRPGANEKIAKMNIDYPGEKETSSFFDLAEILEANGPVELEESRSITLEESYKAGGVIEELEKTANKKEWYPNYHYQMGLVCKEMELIDEAIQHFQLALKMGQRPIEANKLLDQCLKDRGRLEDCKSFERTLQEESAIA